MTKPWRILWLTRGKVERFENMGVHNHRYFRAFVQYSVTGYLHEHRRGTIPGWLTERGIEVRPFRRWPYRVSQAYLTDEQIVEFKLRFG